MMTEVVAITKDGIQNSFDEISIITRVNKNKLTHMIKKFGPNFKDAPVFDRIKEEIRFKKLFVSVIKLFSV